MSAGLAVSGSHCRKRSSAQITAFLSFLRGHKNIKKQPTGLTREVCIFKSYMFYSYSIDDPQISGLQRKGVDRIQSCKNGSLCPSHGS